MTEIAKPDWRTQVKRLNPNEMPSWLSTILIVVLAFLVGGILIFAIGASPLAAYAAQRHGDRIYVRWQLTEDYKEEKRRLIDELTLIWKP